MIAALLLQAATPAAQASPPISPTVVVTGRRPDHDKAVRRVTRKAAPVADAKQPLPRFAAPICPAVAGLPAVYAERFAERMRRDAREAGIAVDRPGCPTNITVLFVPDGQEVVRGLRKAKPEMFGAMDPYDVRRLADDSGPVHLWNLTEVQSRDGDRLRGSTTTGRDVAELQVREASILHASTRLVIDGAIVLIDQDAAIGKTLDQLADYTVMRAVAQARPVGDAAAEPTILRLFDRDPPPSKGLTAFDTAYLRAFYRGSGMDFPLTQVGLMARSINKSLAASVGVAIAK